MHLAFVLYPQFTALDLIGPFNILAYGPDAKTSFVAETTAPVPADIGTLRIPPDTTFDELDGVDVIVVPGGPGWKRITRLHALTAWLARTSGTAQYVTSICTGAFALGAAGLLRGKHATTHWATHAHLAEFGAVPVAERVVVDGNIVTGAGVSAGIDMALTLAGLLWGDETAQAIQLANEYDPRPPYHAGSPAGAPTHLVDALRAQLDQ